MLKIIKTDQRTEETLKTIARIVIANNRRSRFIEFASTSRGVEKWLKDLDHFEDYIGLVVEWTSTAPMALLKLGRNIADEGITGVLRMAKNLITQPDLRRRVMSMRRTFTKYESSMRGVALVARKPL